MFESASDVSDLPADEIISRDAKEYQFAGGQTMCIAQIETVGDTLLDRKDELLDAMDEVQQRQGYAFLALMITDILAKGTELLVAGDRRPAERAFGSPTPDGSISLPGVISRKKQVAPKLLGVS
jgi:manganese-dependent inorganic pyrophosphatase